MNVSAKEIATMAEEILSKAEKEERDLTDEEKGRADGLMDLAEKIHEKRDDKTVTIPRHAVESAEASRRFEIVGVCGRPEYRSIFGVPSRAKDWANLDDFLNSLQYRRGSDPRLERRDLGESVPSSGGFLVPEEFSADFLDTGLENEIVRPKATIYRMASETLRVPGVVVGQHDTDSGPFGGVAASWTAEGGSISETEPTFRSVKMVARKLAALTKSSNELLSDGVGVASQVQRLITNALSWQLDKAFLTGDGAAKPLGILNAPCLITCSAEDGQSPDSIVYENLTNMLSRLAPSSYARATWIVSQSAITELLEMSFEIGTAGQKIEIMSKPSGQWSMLGLPVVITEKLPALGEAGDIVLADLSQYGVALRNDIRMDVSTHESFSMDQVTWRAIVRCDGQPLWNTTMELDNGNTVSPFVTLEAR